MSRVVAGGLAGIRALRGHSFNEAIEKGASSPQHTALVRTVTTYIPESSCLEVAPVSFRQSVCGKMWLIRQVLIKRTFSMLSPKTLGLIQRGQNTDSIVSY
ncbi:hypothetical protein IF1G_07238 [Cordyceps javanica]|uniref:Uncharacterized protein n=1 Tax=Cordyceps javanica TaxID=43265 RepID=A0A545UY34_9HYPO|nr:hypothetical protein IF1G_07238 [Cordyceps javanica]